MFDWAIGGLGELFGWIGDAAGAAVGWAWDKVITGIYHWLANGLAMMIEWVWSVLDSATTPRVTAGWFQNDLAVRVGRARAGDDDRDDARFRGAGGARRSAGADPRRRSRRV